MGVLAAIFALAGAGFNLFQPIISLPTIFSRRFEISIVDILRMIVSNANELSNRNWKLFAEAFTEALRYAQLNDIIQLCVGLAIFITPILALIGAIQAASRKGGSFLLGLCATVCGANFFFRNLSIGGLSYEVRQVVETISSPQIFLLWAALYGVAMFCASFISDDNVVTVKEKETIYVSQQNQRGQYVLLQYARLDIVRWIIFILTLGTTMFLIFAFFHDLVFGSVNVDRMGTGDGLVLILFITSLGFGSVGSFIAFKNPSKQGALYLFIAGVPFGIPLALGNIGWLNLWYLWCVGIYFIAAINCLILSTNTEKNETERLSDEILDIIKYEPEQSTTYEPIIGVETEALIKRAMLFLEDGEFDNAGRYLEQALNQDAENPRVHFAKLMLERKAHNVEELIENHPSSDRFGEGFLFV